MLLGTVVVSGEGERTRDGSGAAGGVSTKGEVVADVGEGEGTASAVCIGGKVGAGPGGVGVQPAANSVSRQKIIPMHFTFVPPG